MLTLYTAVGTLKFQKTTGGKSIPLVINDGQEYGLSDDELLLWSCLAFQILTLHELQDAYTLRQIQKEGPKGLSFQSGSLAAFSFIWKELLVQKSLADI